MTTLDDGRQVFLVDTHGRPPGDLEVPGSPDMVVAVVGCADGWGLQRLNLRTGQVARSHTAYTSQAEALAALRWGTVDWEVGHKIILRKPVNPT